MEGLEKWMAWAIAIAIPITVSIVTVVVIKWDIRRRCEKSEKAYKMHMEKLK